MWLSLHMDRFKSDQANSVVVGEVRAAMARRGVKPLAVSVAIGLNRSSMYRRLSGDTSFSVDELLAIASYLDVSPGSFFPQEVAS